jgi:hypothetical protein
MAPEAGESKGRSVAPALPIPAAAPSELHLERHVALLESQPFVEAMRVGPAGVGGELDEPGVGPPWRAPPHAASSPRRCRARAGRPASARPRPSSPAARGPSSSASASSGRCRPPSRRVRPRTAGRRGSPRSGRRRPDSPAGRRDRRCRHGLRRRPPQTVRRWRARPCAGPPRMTRSVVSGFISGVSGYRMGDVQCRTRRRFATRTVRCSTSSLSRFC